MPDDKSKRGKPDRSRIARGERYEVRHVAERFHVSESTVRRVIRKVGNSRARVYQVLRKRAKAKRRAA